MFWANYAGYTFFYDINLHYIFTFCRKRGISYSDGFHQLRAHCMNKKHQAELLDLLVRLMSPRQICAVMSAIDSENNEKLPSSVQPSPKKTTSAQASQEKKDKAAPPKSHGVTARVNPEAESSMVTISRPAKENDTLEMKLVPGGRQCISISFNQQQVELTFRCVNVVDIEQGQERKVIEQVAPEVRDKEVPLADVPAKKRRRAPKCSNAE